MLAARTTAVQQRGFARATPVAHSRRGLVVMGVTMSSNEFRNGVSIELDGSPFRIIEFLHVKPGKGSAFVRTKLKSYVNGTTLEKTFRAGEQVEQAVMDKRDAQFTYYEGNDCVFMDMETYEETRLPKDDWANYLKEGTVTELLFYNGKVLTVSPPQFMELVVTDCPPNLRGNTISGGSKIATLESGAKMSVPLFINIGETIRVDTIIGEYLSRVNLDKK